MTLKEVAEIAASLKIPWQYDHFDGKIKPPYIVYYYPNETDFIADGVNYANIRAVTFELFTKEKDFDLERAFESRLKAADLAWYKVTDYINDERIYQTSYETGVLIDE